MRCLAQVLSDTKPAFSEVIVVADYDITQVTSEYPQLVWMFHNEKSISAKRNKGCLSAHGNVVAFIDDDCLPAPDWMEKGIAFLGKNPDVAGCEGRTIIDKKDAMAPISEYKRLEQPGYRTNNIFYRKQVVIDAGGFDERFTVQREDADLAYSILEKGQTIAYCPEAIVYHSIRPNEYLDLIKNCINRRFDPLLYKKHRKLYRQHVGCPIPPSIGIIVSLHCIALLMAVFLKEWVGWFLFVEYIVAFVFAWRRNREHHNGIAKFLDGFLFLFAPLFLIGALVYGSIKFKKWLVF